MQTLAVQSAKRSPGTVLLVGLGWLSGVNWILTLGLLQSGSIFNLFLLLCYKIMGILVTTQNVETLTFANFF